MLRGTVAACVALLLVLSVAVVSAQEKSEGMMEKVTDPFKKLIPGGEKEKAAAPKEGESLWQKTKDMVPGGEKGKAAAPKEGEGMMEKMTDSFKKIVPGGDKK